MKLEVDIQVATGDAVPADDDIINWITAALEDRRDVSEVSVRLVDEAEMAALNQRYRDRVGSTNVLSFPADLPGDIDHPLLGDIVICPAVVRREAAEQHKSEQQHWAHMLVHGSLHLLGYDHVDSSEATIMETLEREILANLGFPCPYADNRTALSAAESH